MGVPTIFVGKLGIFSSVCRRTIYPALLPGSCPARNDLQRREIPTPGGFWERVRKQLKQKQLQKAAVQKSAESSRPLEGSPRHQLSCAMSIAIFGVALKFLGSSWLVPGIFFGLSLCFLLLWRPSQLAAVSGAQPA